jgi:hypothetical protein
VLCDAVERAPAAADVAEEESGSVELTTKVLALEAGEAATADVLVREGHQVPACVSREEYPIRRGGTLFKTVREVPFQLGQLFVSRFEDLGQDEQAPKLLDGGGLTQCVEGLMGAREPSADHLADELTAGPAQVEDHRVGVVVPLQQFRQRREPVAPLAVGLGERLG